MYRSRVYGRALETLLLLATSFVPWTAVGAEKESIPVAIEYLPGKACPEEEQFARQLRARLPRVELVAPDRAKVVFHIHFVGSGDELVGHFEIRSADGMRTMRTIPQGSCSEQVAAMAVIAAILLDADTDRTSEPSPALAAPVTGSIRAEARAPQPVDADLQRISYHAGVGGILEGAVVPAFAAGLSLEAGVSLDRSGLLSPSLSGALVRTFPARVNAPPNGTARFEWTALRILASPLRWSLGGPFALRPAVVFDVGRLEGSGEQTTDPGSTAITWSGLGILMRMEVRPLRRLSLCLDGGLVVPLRRDRFYFGPNDRKEVMFAVPRLDATARFGVATHFW